MRTVYIADDGREFDHQDDCREYERQLTYTAGAEMIRGIDGFGKEISYTDDNFCEDVFILFLSTEEAVEIYKKRCGVDYVSTDGIYDPGVYIWDNDDYAEAESSGWTYLPDLLSTYEKKTTELKELKAKFDSMK